MRRLQYRTHRKLLIVDGSVGFTGGVGIAEEWTGDAQDPDHWRDTHVRVRGPVVRGLQGAFAENWLEGTGNVLAGDRYLPDLDEVEDGGPMQVMRSSATVGDTNAEALFFLAVAAAKKSIELTSAYFVPRPAFTKALVEAAERGVDLQILVPGSHIDKEFVRTAGRASYDELLEAGIRLYEYCPTMLHAKSLVVDGIWSCVGSVNFDNRSFQLHDEVTLCVQSERFAGELHDAFEEDLTVSEAIEPGGMEPAGRDAARAGVGDEARAPRALGARQQQHAGDLGGVVPGGHVAAAVQRDGAPVRDRLARPPDEPVELAPRERDRHPDVLHAREDRRRASASWRPSKPGERHVGAHRAGTPPPRGTRSGCAIDPRSTSRRPPRAAEQDRQHGQQRAAEPADVGARPRAERPLPEPGRAQPGHRQRAPRLAPARAPPSRRASCRPRGRRRRRARRGRRRPRRRAPAGVGCDAVRQRRRRAEARQVDRDHVALARQPVEHRLPDDQLAAERMDQDERLAAPAAHVVQHDAAAQRCRTPRRPPAARWTSPIRRSAKPPSQ